MYRVWAVRVVAALILVLALAACGDNIDPIVDVPAGRLTARISPQPAQLELFLDGTLVWSTARGGGEHAKGAPYSFAAVGTLAVTVDGEFGSYKFTENTAAEKWWPIDRLGDVNVSADGATFGMWSGDDRVGTGTLSFIDTPHTGPDPAAAGFPAQVRLELVATTGDRIALAASLVDGEHLVGLGGQSYDVDHRGYTVPLWVQEDGIGKDPTADDDYGGVWFLTGRRHSTHSPMPMTVSSRGYALAVDTDARTIFELGSVVPDAARFEVWDRTLDLQVFVGDGGAAAASRDAQGAMVAWVGKPAPPPPIYFAPWVDAIFGSANVRAVAQALRDNGVSSSVIWTEDWRGGAAGSDVYTLAENWRVDRTLYPDIEQLASDLHGEGFAFLVYNNTFLDSTGDVYQTALDGGYSIHDTTGASYTFTSVKFSPASLLDLSNADAVTWAKSVMTEGLTDGADGWMADYGEWLPTDAVLASGESALAVHNRYPVDWARIGHDLLATAPAGHPAGLYFMRSAWIHSQPLVQVMWPGDQQTDWTDGDGFRSVIPMGIGLGVTGFPYFGSDIAGYQSQGTVPTSEELFYRWATFGALSPVMRTHHGRSAMENFQWQHDAQSIAHFRRWARFHQQLAAYLTGSAASFERDGLPLFRLIALEFPGEDWAWSATDEYLLGDRILVAPVEDQGATSRQVQLPAGTWYPLLGGAAVSGTITADAPVTEIPAFVPAGALLVLYPDGVDTVLAAPGLATATTLTQIGDDREVWLWPGTAADPAYGSWHDTLGPTGAAQWTWSGRPDGASAPASATWNGAAVAITPAAGYSLVTVTGDGTLVLDGGGTLVVARGLPSATVTIRVW
jgi:alpha-glucosidase